MSADNNATLGAHQHLHSSQSNEWYTPPPYIDAVHAVMGGIDVDPASCALANRIVRATTYYTLAEDGFPKAWPGRVFLNPPYGFDEKGQSNAARWSRRLLYQYQAGVTTQAILLVNAVPGNDWFAPLWDYPICFTDHRIRFYNPAGMPNQPTHSNAFVYLGEQVDRFDTVFSQFGVVAVRRSPNVNIIRQLTFSEF